MASEPERPVPPVPSPTENPVPSVPSPAESPADAFRASLSAVVERYRAWPPVWQVVAGVILPIAVLFTGVLLLIVLWYVAIVLFWALLIAAALSPLAAFIYIRRRRTRERHDAAVATLQAEEATRAAAARQRADYLAAVAGGSIEPMPDPGTLLLRNSEVLWYYCPATVTDRGENPHESTLYVTSSRLAFTSPEYPLEIPVSAVNAVQWEGDHCWVTGKTASASELFVTPDAELLAAHIRRAALAAQDETGPSPSAPGEAPRSA